MFKIYFVECEELEPTEIRRFPWQRESGLQELFVKISSVFSARIEPHLISIYSISELGDKIYINSDSELKQLFEEDANLIKLWVARKEELECELKLSTSPVSEDFTDMLFEHQSCDEIETDCIDSRIEFDTKQSSCDPMRSEERTMDLLKSQQKISEGLQRAGSESPKMDARFNTSYGKSSITSTFAQIAKDFGACFSQSNQHSNPSFADLPPKFVESLCTLREMGFDVENPNVLKILRRNNGNLEETISEVMES